MPGFPFARQLPVASALLLAFPLGIQSQDGNGHVTAASLPVSKTLYYTVEWRLITAGSVKLRVTPMGSAESPGIHSELQIASVGLVSKLYKVEDKYFGNYDRGFCAISSQMLASEGRRRRETKVTYDAARNKAVYLERDLIKNTTVRSSEIDIPHCVQDLVGGLLAMSLSHIEVGKSADFPVSDGKKTAMVRVEAQEREDVKINTTTHKTVRYEAFLFNNVLFARKARLFIWLTDDAEKTPVQIRVRMNFPVGTITLSLDKIEQI